MLATNKGMLHLVGFYSGVRENGSAITTNTCPHSEINFTLLKAEMDKL